MFSRRSAVYAQQFVPFLSNPVYTELLLARPWSPWLCMGAVLPPCARSRNKAIVRLEQYHTVCVQIKTDAAGARDTIVVSPPRRVQSHS